VKIAWLRSDFCRPARPPGHLDSLVPKIFPLMKRTTWSHFCLLSFVVLVTYFIILVSQVDFDPVVVTRTSPEGRMMSKWLVAARKKLGGAFPRPDARKQMEKYAQKLRELKMKKARGAVQQTAEDIAKDPFMKELQGDTANVTGQ